MNHYDCEFHFHETNEHDQLVEVYVYFNVVEDFKSISPYNHVKTTEYSDVLVQARLYPTMDDYTPTKLDLEFWNSQINYGIDKQITKRAS